MQGSNNVINVIANQIFIPVSSSFGKEVFSQTSFWLGCLNAVLQIVRSLLEESQSFLLIQPCLTLGKLSRDCCALLTHRLILPDQGFTIHGSIHHRIKAQTLIVKLDARQRNVFGSKHLARFFFVRSGNQCVLTIFQDVLDGSFVL